MIAILAAVVSSSIVTSVSSVYEEQYQASSNMTNSTNVTSAGKMSNDQLQQ
jgi:hypothetical protein